MPSVQSRNAETSRITAVIEKLSAAGDGMIGIPGEPPVYVRGAYLGDRVTVSYEAALGSPRLGRIETLHYRAGAEPICDDFPACGGCRLQQWPAEAYRQRLWEGWEMHARRLLAGRLPSEDGLPAKRSSFWGSAQERRRAQLHWSGELVGFYAPESHRIVPMRRCHVVEPDLWDRVVAWRRLPKPFPRGALRLQSVGECWEGVLELEAASSAAGAIRKRLDRWWRDHGAASGLDRLVWREHGWGRAVLERRMGSCVLRVPPGAFMQASEASERWMQSWVREQWGAVGCPKDLLDLYAGLGTLSLPLLGEGVHLRTVEGSLPSVTALLHARWDEVHGGARPLGWGHRRHEHHDLHRGVMPESWLDAARMAIVNPPRTGGTAAYRALAKARVPSIVSVTCHLPSWERDVRMLVEAGYRMASVACVDQFLWSGHSEWMTLFVLPGATMPCPMAQ